MLLIQVIRDQYFPEIIRGMPYRSITNLPIQLNIKELPNVDGRSQMEG